MSLRTVARLAALAVGTSALWACRDGGDDLPIRTGGGNSGGVRLGDKDGDTDAGMPTGGDFTVANPLPDEKAPPCVPDRAVFIEGYYAPPGEESPGVAFDFDLTTREFSDDRGFQTNADVTGRVHGDKAYIVQRFATDAIQCLNLGTWDACFDFDGTGMLELERYSNPQDIIINDGFAYVSLHNPTTLGDVIKIDLSTGEIVANFQFSPYMNDDDDVNPRASKMVLVGGLLYVLLQDLQSNWSANTVGKLGVINTSTGSIDAVYALDRKNPESIVHNASTNELLITASGDYNNPISPGVEFFVLGDVPEDNYIGGSIIDGNDFFGRFLSYGYPTDIEIAGDTVFISVAYMNGWVHRFSEVITFSASSFIKDLNPWHTTDGQIPDIAVTNTELLVADRHENITNRGVWIYSLADGTSFGNFLADNPPLQTLPYCDPNK
jgi:hypothetical protein